LKTNPIIHKNLGQNNQNSKNSTSSSSGLQIVSSASLVFSIVFGTFFSGGYSNTQIKNQNQTIKTTTAIQ
jgi:hypothetical protein